MKYSYNPYILHWYYSMMDNLYEFYSIKWDCSMEEYVYSQTSLFFSSNTVMWDCSKMACVSIHAFQKQFACKTIWSYDLVCKLGHMTQNNKRVFNSRKWPLAAVACRTHWINKYSLSLEWYSVSKKGICDCLNCST